MAEDTLDPARLRVTRGQLGMSTVELAAVLGVSDRTVRHWEAGRHPVPGGARLALLDVQAATDAYVRRLVDGAAGKREPALLVYRDDAEYRQADPAGPYPASWQRAVAARVAAQVPGLAIRYPVAGQVPRVIGSAAGVPLVAVVVLRGCDAATDAGRALLGRLRAAGVSAAATPWGRPLKGQMVEAARTGARFAALVGEREAQDGVVQLNDLRTQEQREVAADRLVAALREAGAAQA